jgi:hypothetical protein
MHDHFQPIKMLKFQRSVNLRWNFLYRTGSRWLLPKNHLIVTGWFHGPKAFNGREGPKTVIRCWQWHGSHTYLVIKNIGLMISFTGTAICESSLTIIEQQSFELVDINGRPLSKKVIHRRTMSLQKNGPSML